MKSLSGQSKAEKKTGTKREFEGHLSRIVAVDAPGTLMAGFSGKPISFEICLVAPNGDWSVLEAHDEGRSRTSSAGEIMYMQQKDPAHPAAECPTEICELDDESKLFGAGFYVLSANARQKIESLQETKP
mmetsp:Transcript_45457/g.50956  ORF Transcript_45457/g.50956 Transcript_45457/m.50956 type:complete len:130 (-) Transcript_45457:99-488(-)|eukprot:CAMPEP_0170839184 /NCGR_PEP_ID=MMETSP0734-20130129/3840_1 /TAXON_ID=186038 /ORGANISM="Fragilariopsis kerguelensis, Strain L26-C5" /LENGTH=129 /DNA_ID=CAMNT_0011206771 /DNA_START=105 /DNA_END=494 /DNA_ORIENTATION=+